MASEVASLGWAAVCVTGGAFIFRSVRRRSGGGLGFAQ